MIIHLCLNFCENEVNSSAIETNYLQTLHLVTYIIKGIKYQKYGSTDFGI